VAATPTRGGRGSTPTDTGCVEPAGSQGLLGQREGRTSKTVIDWLRERTPEPRDAIEFVAIDPAAVYANAVRTEGLLPNARLVVDHRRTTLALYGTQRMGTDLTVGVDE
jgi:transposase